MLKKLIRFSFDVLCFLCISSTLYASSLTEASLLPSWNEGPSRNAIIKFVSETTKSDSINFVPISDRIATFDQDGTLWVEHPVYTQVMYCIDRILALAEENPELKTKAPFNKILSGNPREIKNLTPEDFEKIAALALSGMPVEEFQKEVLLWLSKAKDPRWHKRYTELIYKPMQELIQYLKDNDYKVYIVTGGGQDFVRVFSETTYRIPPEHVVGSIGEVKFGYNENGSPILTKEPKLLLNDNFTGKPEGIHMMIGKRPVFAAGNSTGDKQMLEYTTGEKGKGLSLLILHDDAKREYAYGPAQNLPDTKIGTLPQMLYEEGKNHGWLIISMKNDWKKIFSFED